MFATASHALMSHRAPRGGFLRSLIGRLEVARQRHALARLDDRQLADIGITRDAADAEAARPFWDSTAAPG